VIISLLLLSDLDEPLGKIGTCLEHQGTRGTTKIRLKGNLFYGPDIRIKNTHLVENLPMIIPGQFGFNYPSGFREEAF
jgi:hypothetical protein